MLKNNLLIGSSFTTHFYFLAVIKFPNLNVEARIPGAVSMPMEERREKRYNLRTSCDVVAYCRVCDCFMSVEDVELLRGRGVYTFRKGEGVHDWENSQNNK